MFLDYICMAEDDHVRIETFLRSCGALQDVGFKGIVAVHEDDKGTFGKLKTIVSCMGNSPIDGMLHDYSIIVLSDCIND